MSKIGKGNKAVSVIMPLDIYELLKMWAESKDWSVSQAAKNLIVDALNRELSSQAAAKTKK